ncbi:PucR family transcriptional regulator [Solicola sp. PLA-1-18]|uniref:PucR family transcriptional regulator n=1 Tax=Solicola sp. PLA-1-18 TaxID=3380532 RepID=UPI003B792F42
MLPTVADVLSLDAVRVGGPAVVAGSTGLQRHVRWVHSAEVVDIAGQLQGGELVLSTGIALPDDHDGLTRYLGTLADAGAVGLVIEMGRRYRDRLPLALVRAADERGLPLVTLCDPTRFVDVTEAVHAIVIDAQVEELRATQEMHHRFTQLSVDGAEPREVLRQASQLAGCPAVLENLNHQVLAYDAAGRPPAGFLADWEPRSRRIRPDARTAYDAASGWLVTRVGARDQDWGRLVLLCDGEPPPRVEVLAERAAATLAVNRLVTREADSLERQTHHGLLVALREHQVPADEIALRADAVGVPLARRRLIALALRPVVASTETAPLTGQAQLRDLAEVAALVCRRHDVPALVGTLDDTQVGVLLAVAPRRVADRDAEASLVTALVGDLRAEAARRPSVADTPLVVGVGTSVAQPVLARRSLEEALQVADAASARPGGALLHRLHDVHVRGLVHLLRDDARLQTFVERELGALLEHDQAHPHSCLLPTVRSYLEHGGNKSRAAEASHLSRQSFYDRLARAGSALDLDLDDPENRLSLHLAVLAWDALR